MRREIMLANIVGAKQAAYPSPTITPNLALPPASPAMKVFDRNERNVRSSQAVGS